MEEIAFRNGMASRNSHEDLTAYRDSSRELHDGHADGWRASAAAVGA